MAVQVKTSVREERRLQTRQRIFGAAIAEFRCVGMADAEVGAIVAAAGVAHGTFYFHFPTKEHVLLELECREEQRIAEEFATYLLHAHDLAAVLAEVTRLVLGLQQRLGEKLFKDILGLHFSVTRPGPDNWNDHPVIVLLVAEIEKARGSGRVHVEVDAFYSAVFFLLGVYGALCSVNSVPARDHMLRQLVATALRGLEVR